MSNIPAVKTWHMKNQKMLVVVEGVKIDKEKDPVNFAGNTWSISYAGQHYVPALKGPDAIYAIRSWLQQRNVRIPEDFGQYIPYPDFVYFHDQQPTHIVYVRVGRKCVEVTDTVGDQTFQFFLGKTHKNYHYAMANALKLANYLITLNKANQ